MIHALENKIHAIFKDYLVGGKRQDITTRAEVKSQNAQ